MSIYDDTSVNLSISHEQSWWQQLLRRNPGDIRKCSFESSGNIELDEDLMKVFKAMLRRKKNKRKERVQKLFPGKQLNFTKRPVELLCPIENCLHQGPKLKRHLQSKCRKFSEETVKTYQSFVRTYINQIKTGKNVDF